MKSLCLLVSFVAVVYGVKTTGHVCTENSQCQPEECCQIMSEFMVVSKRDLVSKISPKQRSGTCEPYTLEGGSCGYFAKANGFCSCEPGTSCKFVSVPMDKSRLSPRRIVAPEPIPGHVWKLQCKKNT